MQENHVLSLNALDENRSWRMAKKKVSVDSWSRRANRVGSVGRLTSRADFLTDWAHAQSVGCFSGLSNFWQTLVGRDQLQLPTIRECDLWIFMEALGSFPAKSAGCFHPKKWQNPLDCCWAKLTGTIPESTLSQGLASAGGSQDRGNGKMLGSQNGKVGYPPKFNSSPLKNGGWKTTFLLGKVAFQGPC